MDPEKPTSNSSPCLKRASEEAMDAIEHPEIWEFGPSMDPGTFCFSTGASNHWSAWHLSSIPSSYWDPHALAESKGYGKGQELWEGQGDTTIGVV